MHRFSLSGLGANPMQGAKRLAHTVHGLAGAPGVLFGTPAGTARACGEARRRGVPRDR